jgi:hypothetical protein
VRQTEEIETKQDFVDIWKGWIDGWTDGWKDVTSTTLCQGTFNVIYMELLVKPEILTSYIYGPTFGNAESSLFPFAARCFNIESMQKVFLYHSCVNTLQLPRLA